MLTRRHLLKSFSSGAAMLAASGLLPAWARSPRSLSEAGITALSGNRFDLDIARSAINIDGRTGEAITVNGTLPAPLLRWQEGEQVTMRVTNHLDEDTSIHWHGMLVPFQMDGVPGVTGRFGFDTNIHRNGCFVASCRTRRAQLFRRTISRRLSRRLRRCPPRRRLVVTVLSSNA